MSCFAEWLQSEHANLPQAEFLGVTGRSAAAASSGHFLHPSLAMPVELERHFLPILTAAGLTPTDCNKQVSRCKWIHIIASPGRAGHSAAPPDETNAHTRQLLSSVARKPSASEGAKAMWAAAFNKRQHSAINQAQ